MNNSSPEWCKEQIKTPLHKISLIIFFLIITKITVTLYYAGYGTRNEVFIYYGLFFIITSWRILKTMIIFSCISGLLLFLFPFLAPIALIIMVLLFLYKLGFILTHWRPVLAGFLIYISAFIFYDSTFNKILLILPGLTINPGIGVILNGLISAIILHKLMQWLYIKGYSTNTAFGIMGSTPLFILSLILPFIKVFSFDGISTHTHIIQNPDTVKVTDIVPPPSGYHNVHAYIRNGPNGLEHVKAHISSNPDSIIENNLSYHAQNTKSLPHIQTQTSETPLLGSVYPLENPDKTKLNKSYFSKNELFFLFLIILFIICLNIGRLVLK